VMRSVLAIVIFLVVEAIKALGRRGRLAAA
jgi:hypothetical protein